MNTRITIHEQLRRHERDLNLFGRLFADWSMGRERKSADVHQQLDAIEAHLARLERTVTMAVPAVRPLPPVTDRPDSRRTAMPLAAQRT